MRESLLGFFSNDFVAGELGTDVMGLFSISTDTFSDTGVLKRKINTNTIRIYCNVYTS